MIQLLDVACPDCGAEVGKPCREPAQRGAVSAHTYRYLARNDARRQQERDRNGNQP